MFLFASDAFDVLFFFYIIGKTEKRKNPRPWIAGEDKDAILVVNKVETIYHGFSCLFGFP